MPSANVDLVLSITAGWERGDFSSSDWADPDIEFEIAGGLEDRSWTGLAAMAKAMHGLLSPWKELRVETDEAREIDDERVLVLHHYRAQGKGSQLEIGEEWTTWKAAALFHVQEGKVRKLIVYANQERPFIDLGLTQRVDSPSH